MTKKSAESWSAPNQELDAGSEKATGKPEAATPPVLDGPIEERLRPSDVATLLGGAALLGVAAWAWTQHKEDSGAKHHELVPPDVVSAVATVDAFFRSGEDFEAVNPSFVEIHAWANVLSRNWELLKDEDRERLLALPATWEDMKVRWSSLTGRQKKLVRASWLPELPEHPHL